MRVAELSAEQLRRRLRSDGLTFRTGPVVTRIRSRFPVVAQGLALLYGDYPLAEADAFCDFDCNISRPAGLRRWLRPQAVFGFDGLAPFTPLAADQALAMMEWGMNWCVSSHCHQYLIIHGAVVARDDGHAVVLPAPPGSGKSTLCAALVCRGWRLLSDELCLIDMTTGELVPLPRPVSLKNNSIAVIQRFEPDAVIGRVTHDTLKGSVAHMRAPRASVELAHVRARFSWLIFPKFQADSPVVAEPITPGAALMALADNAFNYHLQGLAGFERLADLLEGAQCQRFQYGRLDEAIAFFKDLSVPACQS